MIMAMDSAFVAELKDMQKAQQERFAELADRKKK